MFGKEALLSEILDDLGQEVYQEALDVHEFDLYGQAGLEDVEYDPVKFKLVVPLRPTVDLGDYPACASRRLRSFRPRRMWTRRWNRPVSRV